MANAKRASMREGPLAALFRKTEASEGETAGSQPPGPPKGSKPPAQAGTAAASGASAASSPAPDAAPPPAHPRESGLPHPALGAAPQTHQEDPRVPTPRERLRHAFSSEIPENVMERPAGGRVMGEYPREHPALTSAPASVAVSYTHLDVYKRQP